MFVFVIFLAIIACLSTQFQFRTCMASNEIKEKERKEANKETNERTKINEKVTGLS